MKVGKCSVFVARYGCLYWATIVAYDLLYPLRRLHRLASWGTQRFKTIIEKRVES